MIDHFALYNSVGSAAVHWVSDGRTGSNIFLSTNMMVPDRLSSATGFVTLLGC